VRRKHLIASATGLLLSIATLPSAAPAGAEPTAAGPAADLRRADIEFERGTLLLENGEVEGAVQRLGRATELAPDNPTYLGLYAQALLVAGDGAGAAAALERLRALDPDAPGLEYFEGLASFHLEDWVATRDHLELAVAEDPSSALAHLFLGVALHELGEYDAAEATLLEARRLDPALDGQTSYRLGLVNIQQRDYDDARSYFEAVIARSPDSPLARSAATFLLRIDEADVRPWDLYASLGGGYDSNVNVAGNDPAVATGLTSGLGIAEIGGSYRFAIKRVSAQVGQTFFTNFHDSEARPFDVQTSRTFIRGGMPLLGPVGGDFLYAYEFVWADFTQFRGTHAIEPGLYYQVGDLYTRAFVRYESRTFHNTAPPAFDRDGDVTTPGFDAYYFLPDPMGWGESWIRAGYRYRRENTKGTEFDAHGNLPVVTLSLALPSEVVMGLDGRYEWRSFDNPSVVDPAGSRSDRIGTFRTTLQRVLWGNISGEIAYTYTNRDSNLDVFAYDRHEFGVIATYQY
jgi:tetratricopeptide (TPR) repeat protein